MDVRKVPAGCVGKALVLAGTLLLSAAPARAEELPPNGTQPPRRAGQTADRDVDLKRFKLDLLHLKAARTALGEERRALEDPPDEAAAENPEDLARLRQRLAELLGKVSKRPPAPAPVRPPARAPDKLVLPPLSVPPPEAKGPAKVAPFPVPEQPLDPLELAQALYQGGDYDGALAAFRRVDLAGLKAEERVPVQYLIATCLRKKGRLDEALTLYREVANSRGDPVLAECAQWQIGTLRWQRELDGQLHALRQRRQALEKQP